ncbi:bacterio-opsin activator domain-containing protein [Halorarius halobius]|uniref:bacterio-opsin activator domain-containing protein n=1 Tax=Halorarius halobius TaxID=2962671 RepID=UPI0020CE5964|nr:bacterio-opsin activator domain-containing protein [Halorarius halobius]
MSTGDAEVALDGDGYRALRRETGTYRERLVVRLAGETGLRPGEMVEVRPGDVTATVSDGAVHYFLTVDGETGPRDVYLPAAVERELDRYAESNAVGADDRLFDVSARRIQMLVSEVADRAAEATGDRSLAAVSSADLRRRFARRHLDAGVPPSVVMAVGGWRRLDSLAADDSPDRERIAAAFDRDGSAGDDRFRAAFDRLDSPAALLDADGVIEHVNHRFEAVTGLDRGDAVGRELRDLAESVAEHEYAEMWEAVVAGERWAGEVATRVPDGDPIRGRLALAAIGGGPRPDGFVATVRPHDAEGEDPPGRRTLDRLRDVQAAARASGESLADASTREGVLRLACQRLADSDAFLAAWASDAPGDDTEPPTVAAGAAEGVPRGPAGELAARALDEREVRTTTVDADEGPLAVAAVPLAHGETRYGTLTVVRRAPDPAGDRERAALATLGERIGGALAAVEWKRLLLADAVLELEFEGSGADSLFAEASAALDCHIRVEGLVPLEGGSLLYYVTVSGVPPAEALSTVEAAATSARLIADYSDESLLEVTADGDSLPGALVDWGANLTDLVVEGGHVRAVCEVAPSVDVRELATGITEAYPTVDMVAKREVERSVDTPLEFRRAIEERLTSKQRSVLQAAYHAGYFDWPRGSTAEELADSIGVSSPTLHNHLRRAQRKLLAAFFEDGDA